MSVTIKKIAEVAGVSRGTVDRVLNGRGKVRPEVEERVWETARMLDYRPNRIGKALVAHQKEPLRIGVVINGKDNDFFNTVLAGVEAAEAEIRDFNAEILVESTGGYEVDKQLGAIEAVTARGAAGVAIAPINSDKIANALNGLIATGVRVVTFNSDIIGTRRLCFVGCDYVKSGETAAGMMGRMLSGSAQVCIITGSLQMLSHSQRVNGFCRRIAEGYPHLSISEIVENLDSNRLSYELAARILDEYPRLGGIYFAAGGAEGGVRAVCDKDRRAGLTIITCDDTPEVRELIRKGIVDATICQQAFEQGYQAVKLLFDAIASNCPPKNEYYYTDNQIKILENLCHIGLPSKN